MMIDEEIDTSYEPFSREAEYIDANRAFIRTLGLMPRMRILDLACGTATMTDLMLENLFAPMGWGQAPSPDGLDVESLRILGLDLSRESLLLGQSHLQELGFLVRAGGDTSNRADSVHVVDLVEGTADSLPVTDGCADLAIMGNAIQLVDNRKALFSEVRRVLRPGGRFAFNTSFYAGTYCSGTEHVYLRWVQEASSYIAQKSAELKAAGHPAVKRERGTAGKAFSRPWLSIEDYSQEMAEHGLRVESVNERTVMLNQRCFETIGAYAGLARVLLSGYPVKLACEALERASGPTLQAVGMTEVPRYWLEMVAVRDA
jgi:ubiquinone/menaquinone biosynthesis C-methylase UbiE